MRWFPRSDQCLTKRMNGRDRAEVVIHILGVPGSDGRVMQRVADKEEQLDIIVQA